MNRFVASIAAVLFGWNAGHALAQADAARGFPERPVRIIVPFGAGGGTDTSRASSREDERAVPANR
jgi:tripartite-type tricarboxylate transporter receptor subunit TctC